MTLQSGCWRLAALAVAFIGCTTPEKPAPPVAPPVITAFSVDKSTVTRGATVRFSLTAQRARTAAIIDQAGAEVPVTFDADAGTGTATATPTSSSFYILHVDGEGGRDTAFVQVAVDEGLKSVFLVVVPQEVKAGGTVDVLWSAAGGQDVAVLAGTRSLSTASSGSLSDTPTSSTTYTLSGKKSDGTALTTSVTVKVIPVIKAFTAEPPVARPGESITLRWDTAGGERVVVSEASFGQVADSTSSVATGSATFTVPFYEGDAGLDADGGVDADGGTPPVPAVRDGLPLRFTLTLSTAMPAQAVSRAVDGRVGQGPVIDEFLAPAFATVGKPQTLSWQTTNAHRVEVYADGLLVAAPRSGQSLDGRFTVPPIASATEFRLVAYDINGLAVSASRTTSPIAAPVISSFTTPTQVSSAGAPIAATWQTSNANRIVIRVEDGPNLFFSNVMNEVRMGTQTLRVAASATFILDAYNAAGDKVTARSSTAVTTPSGITFSPSPGTPTTPITAQWDVSSLGATDLPGLPGKPPQVTPGSTRFIDLDTVPSATALLFPSKDDGTVTFTAPDGFVFPFVTSRLATFTASVNGALGLGATAVGNANLDVGAAGYAGPALLAPLWDDLDLGARGTVKYFVDGSEFPRTLVVQWSRLEKAGTAGTELTFQVQLLETGEFFFVYKTLTGVDTSSATIGAVESPGTFQHAMGFNVAAAVVEGQETHWFANELARIAGTQTLSLPGARPFGFFVENASGQLIAVQGSARVFAPNAVVVTEVMPVPSPTVPEGRWVEFFNATDQALSLDGLELASASGSMAPFSLQGLSIDAGAFLVVGQSTDSAQNGEANITAAWGTTDVPLADADSVELRIAGMTPVSLSSLSWTNGPADGGVNSAPGESVQPAERAIAASGRLTCPRTVRFGAAMQTGTPGAANETCFEYALSSIPVAYDDISASGTPLFAFGVSVDEVVSNFTLPVPFRYFGVEQSQVWLSSNSWLAFTAQTSAALSNPSAPSASSQPVGAIAPMWDDNQNSATANPGVADSNVYWARRANHTVVQWHRWRRFSTSPPDNMNYQVKLFDTGVIEFHYGTMTSGTTSNNANGNSATIWIARPTGTPAALPVGINQPVLSPNSAYRFTPKP
jgi:hypothetical protein